MQANPASERELVQQCMAELCRLSGFADCHNLVQRDLEFLCESIESKTGVLISLSTMRRLFNGQFSRLPQVATLNAISTFIGYQNWQHFKLASPHIVPPQTAPAQTTPPVAKSRPHHAFFIAAGIVLFAALGLFAILNPPAPAPGRFEKATFSVKKTTSNDLPNTVVFSYDVSRVNADSFFIQQSWDASRRVKIDPSNHTLTDIYYEPGYHVAKLIANDQVIKTMDVSIPTDRWFYYAKERKPGALPAYITVTEPKPGALAMSKDEVTRNGINTDTEHNYIQVYFPTRIQYSSDNFILYCRVRSNEVKNNFCPFFMCEVFCQRNFMFFTTTPKGCTSEANAQFGEKFLSGKTADLSALGSDVKEWQDMKIIVKDRKATVQINNKDVFSTTYNESSGMITGIGFISNGLPEVDFVEIKTADGQTIYSNHFDTPQQ